MEWKFPFALSEDCADLVEPTRDPQYEFARTIAYPRALASIAEVHRAMSALVAVLRAEVAEMRDTVTDRISALKDIDDARRVELATVLAYALLEIRWGFPMSGIHGVRDGQLTIGGRHTLECPRGIEADLNALVDEVPHCTIPAAVTLARATFAAAVDAAWKQLWYVVELGIDAETV